LGPNHVDGPRSEARVLETYFQALDDGAFELASEQFTEDVTYTHPQMYGDTTHIRGRADLLEYLVEARGETDTVHVTDRTVSDDDVVALTGHVESEDGELIDNYVAYAVFSGGRIDYYIAGLLRG